MTVQAAPVEDRDPTPRQACQWRPDPGSAPPPCWHDRATDRDRLLLACATLRRYGIVAAPSQGGAPEHIAQRLVTGIQSAFPAADGACVFWTAADEASCLGPDGALRAQLVVHVRGPGVARAAAAAFEQAGLDAATAQSHDVLLVSGHQPAPPASSVVVAIEPFVGIELRGPATLSQADPAEVRRKVEPTRLRLARFDADAGDGDELRLVLVGRDAAVPVDDTDVADVVRALADRLAWRSITKLRRADLVASETRPRQAP